MNRIRTYRLFKILIIIPLLCLCRESVGQEQQPEKPLSESTRFPDGQNVEKKNKGKWIAFPVLFYLPETKLGFGGVGAYTFRWKNQTENANPTQIQGAATYTLENQLILNSTFKAYFGENDFYVFGEIGYYKFFYRYYGIGAQTKLENEETYKTNYPRFLLNATKQWKKNWFGGLGFWYDNFDMQELQPNGALEKGVVGFNGGRVIGAGLRLIHDTRDNIFYPQKGVYFDIAWLTYGKGIGSDYTFTNLDVTMSKYLPVTEKGLLAVNLVFQSVVGDAPFYHLALHGGARKGRGYEIGRLRDHLVTGLNVEWRQKIKGRLGAVAFAHYGGVAPSFGQIDLSTLKYAIGAGLRFELDKINHLNIRVDYGLGQENGELYITVGEAF